MPNVSWINPAGGNWFVGSNWSSDAEPVGDDDLFITDGNFFGISFSAVGTVEVNSLTLNSPTVTLALQAGTLAVTKDLFLDNGLLGLDGATVQGATIHDNGGVIQFAGGTLDHVTWIGALNVDLAKSKLTVTGGLTVEQPDGTGPGVINLTGNGAVMTFEDAETLDDMTLNLGTAGSGVTISGDDSLGLGADTHVNVVGGASLDSRGTLTNAGSITIENGAGLALDGEQFNNSGSIAIDSGGTLYLEADATLADLKGISNNGGLLEINDILDLAGGTLTIAAGTPFQNISLASAELSNGTVVNQSGTVKLAADLNHITWYGPLDLNPGDLLDVVNGLTVRSLDGTSPGTIDLATGLNFDDPETLNDLTLNVTNSADVYAEGTLTFTSTTTINAAMQPKKMLYLDGGTMTILGTLDNTSGSIFGSVKQFNNGGIIDAMAAGGTFTLSGTTFVNGGTVAVSNGDHLSLQMPIMLNSGVLNVGGYGTIEFANSISNAGSLAFSDQNGLIKLDQLSGFDASISGWVNGDRVELAPTGTYSFDSSSADDRLVIDLNGTQVASLDIGSGYRLDEFSIAQGSGTAPSFIDTSAPVCFLPGTMIASPSGEIPIERLCVGDLVMTAGGAARSIVWIGTGRVVATRGRRGAATPVIVRKGAFADKVPHRDLRVTKAHAFYLDGALIPVEFLVNHRSILWDDRAQEVTLYHVELASHDLLLANGAPAESYRDDGNRWLFHNGNSGWHLPPQEPCAPVLTGGAVVDAVWRRLLECSGPVKTGPLTDDPDLHLLADGRRIDAMQWQGDRHVFRLATRPCDLRIRSRTVVPQELGIARDDRELGVAVRRIVVAQPRWSRAVEADVASLADGFHAFEADHAIRWTNGDAVVPAALFAGMEGPGLLVLHLGGATQYRDDGRMVKAA